MCSKYLFASLGPVYNIKLKDGIYLHAEGKVRCIFACSLRVKEEMFC